MKALIPLLLVLFSLNSFSQTIDLRSVNADENSAEEEDDGDVFGHAAQDMGPSDLDLRLGEREVAGCPARENAAAPGCTESGLA